MKKLFFTIAMGAMVTLGFAQTPAQKVVKTERKIDSAEANIQRLEKEQKAASDAFRKDGKRQIEANDKEIDRLKATLIKPLNSPPNDSAQHKIAQLQERNVELRKKIEK